MRTGPVPTGWVAIWPLSTFLRCDDRHALEAAEIGQQVRGGLLDPDDDGVRSRCADVGDGAELVDVGQLLVDDAPVGVHDVVGGERAAVLERHALAQMKVPGELIGCDTPRFGECGPHLEVLVGFDQGVEHVLQHLEREVGAGLLRIELVGFACDGGDQVARSLPEIHPLGRGAGHRDQQRHHRGDDGRWLSHSHLSTRARTVSSILSELIRS